MSRSVSCTMKIPKGDLLTYAPNGQVRNSSPHSFTPNLNYLKNYLVLLFITLHSLRHIFHYWKKKFHYSENCIICDSVFWVLSACSNLWWSTNWMQCLILCKLNGHDSQSWVWELPGIHDTESGGLWISNFVTHRYQSYFAYKQCRLESND